MYEENGCKEVLPWNEIGEHEIICEYVKLCCPFSSDNFENEEKICTWEGTTFEILDHMEELHWPHRYEDYVQIRFEKDIKKNKLMFSTIQDSIVILLIVIGSESGTYYWKVWTVPDIWRILNYKIEISSEKRQTLTVSKFQKAGLLHPTFFKNKIDNSWFKINFDYMKNFFDSPCFLTAKFYIKGFLIGSTNLSNCDRSLWLVKCHKCGKRRGSHMFVCRSDKKHLICGLCKNSQCHNYENSCPMCHPTICILDSNFVTENLRILFNESFKYCLLCKHKVQCLSSHLSISHNESIFELGKCYNFRLKYYFFSFDDHIFFLSKNINENRDLTFSVQCSGTQNVKYKYKLKLIGTKSSSITFSNFCRPELIDLKYFAGENFNAFTQDTSIPWNLYNSILPDVDEIEFKLNIFKI
ncbi:uncharacterized protein LOC123307500 [Coccinella septempunctata]|uniref:uncharacterized protein LOC123307500 n=1 Tax=Coccinella septempunctata TaxID=41139 RepID=UPI001D088454|nr:uncharacterized protein LOC123307500 [Coccinella septempunctata]